MVNKTIFVAVAFGFLVCACRQDPSTVEERAESARTHPPNILIILADDLGYSDIGPFGSEISTPSLDSIAAEGMVLTQFRVHTMCTPTRAMMMTGRNSHEVGHGTMTAEYTDETRGQPGYEAKLHLDVEILPQKLQQLGYETLVSGKWDLGGRGDPARWPVNRGFDRSYVLIEGSGSHFTNRAALQELPSVTYVEDDQEIALPEDFFSSNAYANKIIEFIGARDQQSKPFFAYLSLTAPHYPLHAPDDYIDRYAGAYDDGYEPIRDQRLVRQRELGVIGADVEAAPRHEVWPKWSELPDEIKALERRRMEIYAAMVENMDTNIGRVVDHLKETGQWENTVVVFFSDNGPEGGNPLDWGGQPWFDWAERSHDMSLENMGRRNSYVWTGPGWGYVSAAPFRYAKGFTTEGGIRSPLVISAPGLIDAGSISHAETHILDLMPTLLELAGNGEALSDRMLGRSFVPVLSGESDSIRQPGDQFGLELLGRRALVKDGWKITWNNTPWGKDKAWMLYDLSSDPTELDDLSDSHPEKLEEMVEAWNSWAENHGVVPIDSYPMGIYNSFTHYEWRPGRQNGEQKAE